MSQIDRYNQGGIGRWYWDYRDRQVIKLIPGGGQSVRDKLIATAGKRANCPPFILDVGCGDMITTRKIPGAVGLDLDKGDIKGSAYELPFEDCSFTCVLLLEVIEHLQHSGLALREIRRVLKPKGRVIILFPHDRNFKIAWALTGEWGEIGRDRGHVEQWDPWAAICLLNTCRLKPVLSKSIPFGWWPISLHGIVVGEKNG